MDRRGPCRSGNPMIDVHELVERREIVWPDWESRFGRNGEVRSVAVSAYTSIPPEPEPQRPRYSAASRTTVAGRRSNAGRPPRTDVPVCLDGAHEWVSHGNQAYCKKCPRTISKHLLPPSVLAAIKPREVIEAPVLPSTTQPKCAKSPNGDHDWRSAGTTKVRCWLCARTARRVTA